MGQLLERILSRYGRRIRIQGKEEPIGAFFQPVTGKSANMVQMTATPVGIVQQKQYVYLGPMEPVLQMDDVLEVDGKEYVVRRAEQIGGLDEPVYQWAMCVEKGALDEWGMNG